MHSVDLWHRTAVPVAAQQYTALKSDTCSQTIWTEKYQTPDTFTLKFSFTVLQNISFLADFQLSLKCARKYPGVMKFGDHCLNQRIVCRFTSLLPTHSC
jgi:hypothetical protein